MFLGLVGDVPVFLAKPQTYMNLSGESVITRISCLFYPHILLSPIFNLFYCWRYECHSFNLFELISVRVR